MSGWVERWTGLVLREPGFLLAALAVVLALAWLRGRPPAARFAAHRLAASAPRGARARLGFVVPVLVVLGWAALGTAMARPAERGEVARPREGIDVVLCLDVSSSMQARDLDPDRTRLDVARDAAEAFVRRRDEDRIGLVTFARYPELRCPPTRDHDALAALLGAVETVESDGPEDATGIGTAVARAAEVLGAGPRSRTAVLLTDGEENVALEGAAGEIAPSHAAQLCRDMGIRVYTIAVGRGRPDPSGAWVPIDTRAVEALSERTGGTFQAAADAEALDRVYARIDRLEKAPAFETLAVLEDRHLPFLLAGLAVLVLARLLGARIGPLP